MKPRISLYRGARSEPVWACADILAFGIGETPNDAYREWLRATLAKCMGPGVVVDDVVDPTKILGWTHP